MPGAHSRSSQPWGTPIGPSTVVGQNGFGTHPTPQEAQASPKRRDVQTP